jgi:hypothetical protein
MALLKMPGAADPASMEAIDLCPFGANIVDAQ